MVFYVPVFREFSVLFQIFIKVLHFYRIVSMSPLFSGYLYVLKLKRSKYGANYTLNDSP